MIFFLGAPVFMREILAHARRTRTYVFQTIFLAALVFALIPLWPASSGTSGAAIADRGRMIFEYGGYLQVILLALLAPALTANAITEEKDKNTLDLLLLSGAGPFAIVWGKFFSRLFNLVFLLFLTVPLLFALLTLGGVSAGSILVEFLILVSFAVLGAGVGIFLSTIMPKATSVLISGYVIMAGLLALPMALERVGVFSSRPGTFAPASAYISPFYDLIYLFQPSRFVAQESFPSHWWVAPAWSIAVGLGLVLLSGLILPVAHRFERAMSLRKSLEAFDRLTFFLLRPRHMLGKLLKTQSEQEKAKLKKERDGEPRVIGKENPIYWKETSVNTIGRFRYWWRVNLAVLVLMLGSYAVFSRLPSLSGTGGTILADIEFHKLTVAILTGVIVLLTTIIAATTVSQEREDGSLILLACTPVDCPTYVKGKVRGIARNIVFLVGLPFLHVAIFILAGVIHPVTFLFLLLSIPVAVVASIMQGTFVSLLFPTTLRAIVAAIVVVILEAALPLVCCLPSFNLPLACYFMVEPVEGLGQTFQAGSQTSYLWAMLLALVFSAGTQLGYTVVVFSLIRSGFDRYIGRAA